MDEDDLLADFLPSREGAVALLTLQYHVFGTDIDEAELGPETLKLRERYRRTNVKKFHASLAPTFKGTSEDLAAALNEQDTWLSDPVNNLLSRIGGHLFLKEDYVACTEKSVQVVSEEPYFIPIEPTALEKRQIREYKTDIQLFNEAVDMIKDLKAQLDGR